MTPEDTIELLKGMQNKKVDYAELVCTPAFASGYKYVYPEPEDYAIEEAIKALEEIQQYREIGTVEECRADREKQSPKKPRILVSRGGKGGKYYACPSCGGVIGKYIPFCRSCGQAIQWDENLEGMEDV